MDAFIQVIFPLLSRKARHATLCLLLMTHLVEEEISSIPLNWKHAPDQEETLQHQVCGEGVAETKTNIRKIFWRQIQCKICHQS